MRRISLLILIFLTFASCEEQVSSETEEPRERAEALMNHGQTADDHDAALVVTSENFNLNNAAILNSCNYLDSPSKGWVLITSKEGNFRIQFPYTPKKETEKHFIDDHVVKTTIYTVDIVKEGLADNNLVYAISFTKDIKMSYYHSFDGYVKAQIAGNIKDAHAELKSDKKLKLKKGAEGREQLYTLKGTDIAILYRIIEFKNVIYTLSVATGKNHFNNPEGLDFFNSFDFISS